MRVSGSRTFLKRLSCRKLSEEFHVTCYLLSLFAFKTVAKMFSIVIYETSASVMQRHEAHEEVDVVGAEIAPKGFIPMRFWQAVAETRGNPS